MWFDGDSGSFNLEFVWNNIVAKQILILVQNYKVISLSGSYFEDVFWLSQPS
jgi:hypothetical protein